METRTMASKKEKVTSDLTKADFEKLHLRLRELDNGWAETLVQMVNRELDTDPVRYSSMTKCDRIKVYNVFNGVVRNTKWKMLIYAMGLKFITDRETALTNLKDQARQIV
ncbi:MAG TPA: hypothetical protein VFU05_09335 [Cyclobacteriaceae bacterium]|nr:hypothetical protein [Cyclobacteriaceae bacterium]